MDESSLRAKLLSGAKWSVALRLVTQAYKWIITLVMVRLLTPQDYGLNAMLEAPVEILALVGTLGIDYAVIRFGLRDPKQLAAAFGWLLLTHGMIFVGLLVSAPWIANYFQAPALDALVRASAVVFVLAPFRMLPNALLDISLDFKLKAQVDLKATLVASLIGLGLAWSGAGVWALVAVTVLHALLTAALLAWYQPWFIRPILDLAAAKSLITYGLTIISGTFITMLAGKVLSVVGGPMIGPDLLGLFSVAALFSYLPITKMMPIVQQTLYPAYAKMADTPTLVRKYMLYAYEICFLTVVPVGICIAAVADPLVTAIFGIKWQSAALPLAVLSMLTPIRLINLLSQTPLNATGHAGSVARVALINLILVIAGIVLATPYGLAGLCAHSVCITFAQATFAQVTVSRCIGLRLRELVAVLWRPIIATSLLGTAAWLAVEALSTWSAWARLGIGVLSGGAVYMAALHVLMRNRVLLLWSVLRPSKPDQETRT